MQRCQWSGTSGTPICRIFTEPFLFLKMLVLSDFGDLVVFLFFFGLPGDLQLNCCFAFFVEKQRIIAEKSWRVDDDSNVAGWYLRWQRTVLDVGFLSAEKLL